jgi:hypothetical protein
MKNLYRKSLLGNFFIGAAIAAVMLLPNIALSQSLKERIVGPWRLVALYNEADGVKSHPYGEKPLGLILYDKSGYVMQYLTQPALPNFAIPNRLKGTDAEYRAVMQGSLSGFGTYTVEGNTLIINWVASTYPNRAGTTEKRSFKIEGNELSTVNQTASAGGTSYANYVRAR